MVVAVQQPLAEYTAIFTMFAMTASLSLETLIDDINIFLHNSALVEFLGFKPLRFLED